MRSNSSGRQQQQQQQQDHNSSGFGPLMLATLQGLTRSRPDLLADSLSSTPLRPGSASFSVGDSSFNGGGGGGGNGGDRLRARLEEVLGGGSELLREFERIPRRRLDSSGGSLTVGGLLRTASLAENLPRSRFRDVLPYEDNRVRLSGADRDNRTGFVNASHVSAVSVGADHRQRFYIAAQSPLPGTVNHFWQMVMQCDVRLVVMLAEPTAGGGGGGGGGGAGAGSASAIMPYWPEKDGSTLELGSEFRIVKKSSSNQVREQFYIHFSA